MVMESLFRWQLMEFITEGTPVIRIRLCEKCSALLERWETDRCYDCKHYTPVTFAEMIEQ